MRHQTFSITPDYLPIKKSSFPFHLIIKPVGRACNLACGYCYYEQSKKNQGSISSQLLEELIKQYIQSQPHYVKEINFVWQGGEPLLAGIEFFEKVLFFQKKYQHKDVLITNSLQTNGTLLDEKWSCFFKENHFLLGISIDGTELIHNQFRPNKKGGGSYLKTISGLKILHKHCVDFNVLTVVHDQMV